MRQLSRLEKLERVYNGMMIMRAYQNAICPVLDEMINGAVVHLISLLFRLGNRFGGLF